MGSLSRFCSWWGCLGCYDCARDLRQHYRRGTRVWAPPHGDAESVGHGAVVADGGPRGCASVLTKRRARGSDVESAIGGRSSTDAELLDMDADMDAASIQPHKRTGYSIFAARLGIMVMITILIGLLTILTWHFTTVYTTRSIKSLALGLRTEILQRPLGRIWNILNATLDTTKTHANLASAVVDQYPIPGAQDQFERSMRNISWAVFKSQPLVSALSLIYINGVFQSYERNPNTLDEYFVYSLPVNSSLAQSPTSAPTAAGPMEDFFPADGNSGQFAWYRQRVDNTSGHEAGPPNAIAPYNLSQELDGVFLLKAGDVAWHATDQGAYETPFLAAGSPVVHPVTGDVVAVVSVKRALSSVSGLMKDITSRYSGIMYLTNADGWLLASSTSAPLLKSTPNGPSLIRAEESTDHVIKICAEWLAESYGTVLDSLQSVHDENVMLAGSKYYVDTFVLNLSELPLLGVIVTPEAYVMGDVERRGNATVAILIAISVCFLIAGCLFTLIFTTGVSSEMKLRSQVIDHLDARRRAEKSSTYKSQFLANMSHELRTPMAAVIGLLDILLCDEYMSSEQVAMVSQIRHCSTALLRLLNNILDLSKVESGKFALDEADFDLRHELEGLVDMFSVQCPDHNIEVVLDLADDLPRLVRGDSARTVQIFANLIANSIKFTSSGHVLVQGGCEPSSGGRRVHFGGRHGPLDQNNVQSAKAGSVRNEDSSQHSDMLCLWFEVDDTGCGIDPRKWETVFDSFVQADPSTTRTYGGTGLGLCIVRSLVRSMGGEIKIARKDGPGTLLKFYLYFKEPQDSAIPRTLKDDITSTFFFESLQHSRLLFSLQGYTGRGAMITWMRDYGLLVSEASTWEDTIAELEEMVQDETVPKLQLLAILDISLVPQSSDLDILDKYTKQGVLIGWLLNHNTTSASKSVLRKKGFSSMANKPVYKSKLVQLIRMLVGCRKEGGDIDSSAPLSVSTSKEPQGGHRGMGRLLSSKVLLRSNANSVGTLVKTSEHSSEELPLIEERQRSSDEFPIYKPRNYLDTYLTGLRQSQYSSTGINGWSEELDETPGLEHDHDSTVSLLESDVLTGFSGEADMHEDGLVVDQTQQNGPLPSTTRTQEQSGGQDREQGLGAARAGGCRLEELEDKLVPVDSMHDQSVPVDSMHDQSPDDNVDIQKSSNVISEAQGSPSPLVPITTCSPLEQSKPAVGPIQDGAGKVSVQPQGAVSAPLPTPSKTVRISTSSRFGPKDALKGIRILLAEDTPVLQRVATMMLEKMGASVVPVDDGLEAVDALTITSGADPESGRGKRQLKYADPSLAPFDLVLMDCQMPKMDGYDATRAIRSAEEGTGCHIPIIALTAHAMSSDEAKCLEVGMDAYLTKPIDHKLMMYTITSFAKIESDPS